MDDFLSLEGLLRDRLQEQVPGLRKVYSVDDLQGAQEQAQRTPAAHILYTGATPVQERGDQAVVQVEQTWTIIIAVRYVRDTSGARSDAGGILQAVLEALQGWRPSPEHSPLSMTRAPLRPDYGNGFAYFPVAFNARITIRSQEQ